VQTDQCGVAGVEECVQGKRRATDQNGRGGCVGVRRTDDEGATKRRACKRRADVRCDVCRKKLKTHHYDPTTVLVGTVGGHQSGRCACHAGPRVRVGGQMEVSGRAGRRGQMCVPRRATRASRQAYGRGRAGRQARADIMWCLQTESESEKNKNKERRTIVSRRAAGTKLRPA
jgi:hypothetical protein